MGASLKEKLTGLLVNKHALTAEKLEEAFKLQKETPQIMSAARHLDLDQCFDCLAICETVAHRRIARNPLGEWHSFRKLLLLK